MFVAVHYRVYFQKDDGFIYEAQYDSTEDTSAFHTVTSLFQAKIGTNLAAVLINQSPPQIRVFYQDVNYAIQEQVFNGSFWTQGTGSTGLPSDNASPITSLGAIAWNGSETSEIRVYYQKSDATLGEIVFDGSWTLGQNFSNLGYPGSGIGATILGNSSLPASPLLRVYYQGRDTRLHELAYNGTNWSDTLIRVGIAPTTPAPGAGITAVNWFDNGFTESQIKVYFETATGNIAQAAYIADSGWLRPAIINTVVAGFRTPIAATLYGNGTDLNIHIWVQSSTQNLLTFTHIFWSSMGFIFQPAGF
jgi:hypothetical protein